MLKQILFIFIFISSVFAYDFKACQQKLSSSMEKIGLNYAVAISSKNGKSILFYYSQKSMPKGYKIIKHDPFTGMYLLESNKKLTPIQIKEIDSDILEQEIASILPTKSVSGKINTRQQSPIDFATLNTPTFNASPLATVCDSVYGIGIGDSKFIEKKYIDRFVDNPIYYGDIGIRVVQDHNGFIIVNLVDPFFKNNPFLYGDVIISINGETISDLASFHRVVFDLPKGDSIPVTIERNNNIVNTSVTVDSRIGGLLLPENFLSRIGIEISNDFTITNISKNAKNGFEKLMIGDKVIRINNKQTPNGYNNIIKMLGEFPDQEQKWLISRKDFQFFINVNTKDKDNEEYLTEYIR